MKFLVISDTHGDIKKAIAIYENYTDIDAIIHLGDTKKDADELSHLIGTDVISVKGNMDNGYRTDDAFKTIDTECGRLLITHGHMQNVKSSLTNLIYLAEEHSCIAALFGHTHIAVCENINGLYLINPGSLTYPVPGATASYALVTTSEKGINAEIKYYSPENLKTSEKSSGKAKQSTVSPKSKVQGGFLRNLLNNSDRL